MDSILDSIKKIIGAEQLGTDFDADIIFAINTVFSLLSQKGIGPETPFMIEDATAKWTDFMEDIDEHREVINYMGAKVRLIFDPPTSSTHLSVLQETAKELETMLYYKANYPVE